MLGGSRHEEPSGKALSAQQLVKAFRPPRTSEPKDSSRSKSKKTQVRCLGGCDQDFPSLDPKKNRICPRCTKRGQDVRLRDEGNTAVSHTAFQFLNTDPEPADLDFVYGYQPQEMDDSEARG